MESPKTPSFAAKPPAQLPPPPDAKVDPEGYLTSLQAVRQRSQLVFEKVRQGKGKCFTLDPGKMDDVITYVVRIIKVCNIVRAMRLICREIMILHIQVFRRTDDGNILMPVEGNGWNNL